jgi:hypothetical protein
MAGSLAFRDVTAVSIRNDATFTVLDETDGYIVVNKPAPLQIHPGDPNGPPTLWHRLCDLLSYEIANGGQVSIINRLDRETSGVVLVAKSQPVARLFGMAMQERKIHKTYTALVHGWPEWEEQIVNAPILSARDVGISDIWVKQIVHEQGVPCRTEFRTLQRFERRWHEVRLDRSEARNRPHASNPRPSSSPRPSHRRRQALRPRRPLLPGVHRNRLDSLLWRRNSSCHARRCIHHASNSISKAFRVSGKHRLHRSSGFEPNIAMRRSSREAKRQRTRD